MKAVRSILATFITRTYTYQIEMMLFGLINAPSIFQRIMDAVLENITLAHAYLNDVVIHSKTMDEHINHWQKVSTVMSEYRLQLKISKCEFGKNKLEPLIHI